jgi:nucleoside 2-deoxyribosyltransferase
MRKPVRVYLAGKMGGRLGSDVLNERLTAAEACDDAGVEYSDPAANEHIEPSKVVDLKMDYLTMKAFVAKDEYAIRNCDVLLVLTGDTSSEGTAWEMGLAHFELKIPVILVAPKRAAGRANGIQQH